MEETREIRKLYSFFQGFIYFTVILEFSVFILLADGVFPGPVVQILRQIGSLPIYQDIYYSKVFTFCIILMVSIGTHSRKELDLDPWKSIWGPLLTGSAFLFGSPFFYFFDLHIYLTGSISIFDCLYITLSLAGGILVHTALDNISKLVKSSLMKDRFNTENESFQQNSKLVETPYSVNIPMQYYYKKKVNDGWLNISNPFRASLVIGTPGSGKTFGIILPFIKQHLKKGFSALVYDYKSPDLSRVAYYHYLKGRKHGVLKKHRFHVIDLNNVEYSRRVNPLKPAYIKTLAEATETADALLKALRKTDNHTASDQFFTQSAVNLLSCIIYFLSRYGDGSCSTLPHALSFMNRPYDELFGVLYTEPELESLLSPFQSAFEKKAFDQLEGQLGTLKVNISRLATKETFWVFSGDDFNLKISDPEEPSVLVLAGNPDTQEINSACYSVVLNRLTRLINRKGNLPTSLIIDEVPTLYLHRIENLIATARSNKVSVLMGLQGLPQFRQQYGKQTADTICAVVANIIAGQVRNKETLDWLEKLFGRVRQVKTSLSVDRSRSSVSLSEHLDYLIPASKISSLQSGQLVASIAQESVRFQGKYIHSMYNCKVNINTKEVGREERRYGDLPKFYDFGSRKRKEELLGNNMARINREVDQIVRSHKAFI